MEEDKQNLDYSSEPQAAANDDISLYYDWTVPKGKHLSRVSEFHRKMIEAVNQDLTTSFLNPIEKSLVHQLLQCEGSTVEFCDQTGHDLSGAQRLIARLISNYVNTSKGSQGNLLKVIRTTWSINEARHNIKDERVEATSNVNDKFDLFEKTPFKMKEG